MCANTVGAGNQRAPRPRAATSHGTGDPSSPWIGALAPIAGQSMADHEAPAAPAAKHRSAATTRRHSAPNRPIRRRTIIFAVPRPRFCERAPASDGGRGRSGLDAAGGRFGSPSCRRPSVGRLPPGLAEAPRRPRREAPETAEARRGARPLLNCRGAKFGNHQLYSGSSADLSSVILFRGRRFDSCGRFSIFNLPSKQQTIVNSETKNTMKIVKEF